MSVLSCIVVFYKVDTGNTGENNAIPPGPSYNT